VNPNFKRGVRAVVKDEAEGVKDYTKLATEAPTPEAKRVLLSHAGDEARHAREDRAILSGDPPDVVAGRSFKVKVRSRHVMGDYVALHGQMPRNELPVKLRGRIKPDEIWIREDAYANPQRRQAILKKHEPYELNLMGVQGLTYKEAHAKAERAFP
jgi:hypothetical protein